MGRLKTKTCKKNGGLTFTSRIMILHGLNKWVKMFSISSDRLKVNVERLGIILNMKLMRRGGSRLLRSSRGLGMKIKVAGQSRVLTKNIQKTN